MGAPYSFVCARPMGSQPRDVPGTVQGDAENRLIANLPSIEGRALGREFARMCDQEMVKPASVGARCPTCACRRGTFANGCAVTLMTLLKCAIERTPFICHEDDKPCRGWIALRFDEAGSAPWPLIDGYSEPGWGRPPPEPTRSLSEGHAITRAIGRTLDQSR